MKTDLCGCVFFLELLARVVTLRRRECLCSDTKSGLVMVWLLLLSHVTYTRDIYNTYSYDLVPELILSCLIVTVCMCLWSINITCYQCIFFEKMKEYSKKNELCTSLEWATIITLCPPIFLYHSAMFFLYITY